MNEVYKCYKCQETFEDVFECFEHESECVGDSVQRVVPNAATSDVPVTDEPPRSDERRSPVTPQGVYVQIKKDIAAKDDYELAAHLSRLEDALIDQGELTLAATLGGCRARLIKATDVASEASGRRNSTK